MKLLRSPAQHTIEKMLVKNKVSTVLELTCGTGSQVFYLAKLGFTVTGSDISPGMLKVAKSKARKEKVSVKLQKGDMRAIQAGKLEAAITIFNAIGHLTKLGFEKAMRNIHRNLNEWGIYLFDIFNLSYFLLGNNITKLSIEWIRTVGDTKIREVQHSVIDNNGVMVSYNPNYEQKGVGKLKMVKSLWTLQLYTAKELKEMLARKGLKVLGEYGMDRLRFVEGKTERILTVAKKR